MLRTIHEEHIKRNSFVYTVRWRSNINAQLFCRKRTEHEMNVIDRTVPENAV